MICEVILLGGGGSYWAGGEHHAHVDRYDIFKIHICINMWIRTFDKDTFLYNLSDKCIL